MNITFDARPEGNMIITEKGVILSFKEITGVINQNELASLRGKPNTKFHVTAVQDLKYIGVLDKIKIDKNGVAIIFNVETPLEDIDLNLIVRMYADPDPWQVRLSDNQRSLNEYQLKLKLQEEFSLSQTAKEKLKEASEILHDDDSSSEEEGQ